MDYIAIFITGHVDGYASPGWLKEELQKLLDRHPPFIGTHLKVKIVEVLGVDPIGGIHRAQTKAG